MPKSLDSDLKSFVESEIVNVCDGVECDTSSFITNKSEKFVASFLKDDDGNLVVNEEVHRLMHLYRRKARRRGYYLNAIFGAFGHGKTEQMCTGLVCYEIAKNPNILIKIVHVAEKEAVNRVRAIQEYVKVDPDYRKLAPHIQPTPIWGQEKFIVKRKAISKDPTVQGFGVLSATLGGRAHLIIFDDPQDLRTAVLEPTTRENIELTIRTTWLTRLIPGKSEVLVLMNRWHENDLVNYITNNPAWSWMSIEVKENKEGLIYKDSFSKKEYHIPLWSKYTTQDLQIKHTVMGDRDYKRGFELKPYSDKDKTFPSFEDCCIYGIRPMVYLDDIRDWVFVGGIDFAGTKRPGTTLTITAIHRVEGLKIPIELYALEKTSDLPNFIVDTYKRLGVELYFAENNATQSAIIDLMEAYLDEDKFRRYRIKIEPFLTGKNKADPLSGLPSLQKEFERKEWIFCFEKRIETTEYDERDIWSRFFNEMKHHPFYKTTDLTMGLWFTQKAAQQVIRKGRGPNIF